MQLAQDQLERTRAQVEVGMLAPVEETQAEVAVAQRRNDLIVARNGLANAADTLRALLKADTLPSGWATEIDATEPPEVAIEQVDIDESIETALMNRPEVGTARAQIAARRVEVNAADNALLPALDVVGGLSFNGIGGTQLVFDPESGFPPVVIGTIPGGYGDAAGDLFGFDYTTWRLGFNFTMPIGNHTAKGTYAQATLNEDKARTDLERVEQQTILEVRQAVRAVADAGELVTSTRATRELAERQLAIEQDRFDVGMSTNFEVLSFQDDLAQAQVQELRAVIDYRRARAALARVTGVIATRYGIQIQ
jgi:outer membrane protein TolC